MKEELSLLLTNATQLITLAGGSTPRISSEMKELGIIEGGSVAVSGSRIVDVGTERELKGRCLVNPNTCVIDCRNKIVVPGFIDSHTHPVFSTFRLDEYEMRTAGVSYQEIAERGGGINASVSGVRKASEEELLKTSLHRLDGFLMHGTTTIEAKSGYGLTLEDELKSLRIISRLGRLHPLDLVPTFLGAHAIPPEFSDNRGGYLELIKGEMIPRIAKEELAAYCDVFVEEGYFTRDEAREILKVAADAGMRGRVHADELSGMGGAELAAELGAITADHLVYISEGGIAAMAEQGVIAVLLPGTTFFLGSKDYAPAREMIDQGVPLALATDFNPGSCTTLNLQQIMSIAVTQLGISPAEALTSVTVNAACAIGMENVLGSIEIEKNADLTILDVEDFREISYVFGLNYCDTVIKRGKVVVEGGEIAAVAGEAIE